jgi:hypothetical protein
MTAQLKRLIDTTGALWQEGALEDKPAGIFSSANNTNGGQEATILTTMIPLLHLGMIIVGTPYGQNPQLFTDKPVGSSPYGPAAVAGPDGYKAVHEDDLSVARSLGERVAKVAKPQGAARQLASTLGNPCFKRKPVTASVMYDAVVVPGSEKSIQTLSTHGDALHFVNEAFKHHKTVAVLQEGVDFFSSAPNSPTETGLANKGS